MSIVARELCKNFGALRAVDRVSFEIAPRGIVGLIGPNGSGKTTILRMLAGFLSPTAGTIQIGRGDVDFRAAGGRLGYLPEHLPDFGEARVEEFLTFRARLKGIDRRTRRAEVGRCLDCCQLTTVRRRLMGRLSQGFRRRVGLAEALLGRPEILLLDEPTIGLDPLQVRHTRELLAELSRTSTVLLSTHLLAEAQASCQRVLVLVAGRLVCEIDVGELSSEAGFEIELCAPPAECESFLLAQRDVRSVQLIDSRGEWQRFVVSAAGADVRARTAAACIQRGWLVRELRGLAASLEDHFVRVTLAPRREAA